MIELSTSASSGLTTSSRSASVLDEAVVGQFEEFLDADPGGAQDFHDSEGPKGVVLLVCEVAALARGWIVGPDPVAMGVRSDRADQGVAVGGEGLTRTA